MCRSVRAFAGGSEILISIPFGHDERGRSEIDSVFRRAKNLPSSEHDPFVARECGDAPAVLAAVQKLLAEDVETKTLAPRRAHALQPDDLLAGRFTILRFLGRGGMGEVYEAADRELGGTVALKVLRPELLDQAHFLERFRREVQTARQVTHRNICRIFDVGFHSADGRELTFLTMEFLAGETLSQRLRTRGRMTTAEALPIVQQMADGLDALHERGIVHRDFKPGNVMIVPAGTPDSPRAVIADFGLARAVAAESGEDPETGPTQPGHIVGTPDYMAPEQLLGHNIRAHRISMRWAW